MRPWVHVRFSLRRARRCCLWSISPGRITANLELPSQRLLGRARATTAGATRPSQAIQNPMSQLYSRSPPVFRGSLPDLEASIAKYDKYADPARETRTVGIFGAPNNPISKRQAHAMGTIHKSGTGLFAGTWGCTSFVGRLIGPAPPRAVPRFVSPLLAPLLNSSQNSCELSGRIFSSHFPVANSYPEN